MNVEKTNEKKYKMDAESHRNLMYVNQNGNEFEENRDETNLIMSRLDKNKK
jgi:hypothetical protein